MRAILELLKIQMKNANFVFQTKYSDFVHVLQWEIPSTPLLSNKLIQWLAISRPSDILMNEKAILVDPVKINCKTWTKYHW